MKKLLLVFLIVNIFVVKAQTNFMAPGATWHYLIPSGGWSFPYVENNHVIKYTGDSLYNGRMTKVLSNISYYHTSCANWYDTLLIYTSNDSVFFHGSQNVHDWELLYNYNAQAGQSWQLSFNNYYGIDTVTIVVDSVKYNFINSVPLKTLYVHYHDIAHLNTGQSSNYIYSSTIYDRIGDNGCLLNYISTLQADPCYQTYLLCYSDSALSTYQPDTNKSCNYSFTEGIEQLTNISAQIKVYPNPASNSLEVIVSNEQIAEIKIYDVLGKELFEQLKPTPNISRERNSCTVDVSNLSNGVYFINIKTAEGIVTKKVVVQH